MEPVFTLRNILDERVREADSRLYEKLDRDRVRCYSCGHCCPIPEGQAGVCKVRYNRGGTLYAPWGYVAGTQCDPIEKKPFFHAYPGALAYSFGMLGCDLHCSYCQNGVTSQGLRAPTAVGSPLGAPPTPPTGGRGQPHPDTVRPPDEMGFWLEIVTLLIPGFNDSDDELQRLTEF